MEALFEGDLIRPLGKLTLYFGYAEYEVDALLTFLSSAGSTSTPPRTAPLGQKLSTARKHLGRLHLAEASEIILMIDGVRPLIALRNSLVHSCILAKGRVMSHDKSQPELTTSCEQLNQLAEDIWNWKEQMSVARQLRLQPALLHSSRHES
jgi:hypothetical protein